MEMIDGKHPNHSGRLPRHEHRRHPRLPAAADVRSGHQLLHPRLQLVESRRSRQGRIVDLAAGAGSNLRYLSPRLPFEQAWTLVDHDDDIG